MRVDPVLEGLGLIGVVAVGGLDGQVTTGGGRVGHQSEQVVDEDGAQPAGGGFTGAGREGASHRHEVGWYVVGSQRKTGVKNGVAPLVVGAAPCRLVGDQALWQGRYGLDNRLLGRSLSPAWSGRGGAGLVVRGARLPGCVGVG